MNYRIINLLQRDILKKYIRLFTGLHIYHVTMNNLVHIRSRFSFWKVM